MPRAEELRTLLVIKTAFADSLKTDLNSLDQALALDVRFLQTPREQIRSQTFHDPTLIAHEMWVVRMKV